MECYVCHNQEGNKDKCVKTSMQCLENEDTCMTNISYTGLSVLFIILYYYNDELLIKDHVLSYAKHITVNLQNYEGIIADLLLPTFA